MNKREAVILILVGSFLLLLNLEIVTKQYIVLFVGLGLLTLYLFDKNSALIIPGFIVSSVGLFNVLKAQLAIPQPFLLIFIGLAFLGIYFFEKKTHSWAIYPGAAVTFTGVYHYIRDYTSFNDITKIFLPLVLIAIGIVVLVKNWDR